MLSLKWIPKAEKGNRGCNLAAVTRSHYSYCARSVQGVIDTDGPVQRGHHGMYGIGLATPLDRGGTALSLPVGLCRFHWDRRVCAIYFDRAGYDSPRRFVLFPLSWRDTLSNTWRNARLVQLPLSRHM